MQPDGIMVEERAADWGRSLAFLATAWLALFWMTFPGFYVTISV